MLNTYGYAIKHIFEDIENKKMTVEQGMERISAMKTARTEKPPKAMASKKPATLVYRPKWETADDQSFAEKQKRSDNILIFDFNTDIKDYFASNLKYRRDFDPKINVVLPGGRFRVSDDGVFEINPKRPDDFVLLMETLQGTNRIPDMIVHHWSAFNAATAGYEDLAVNIEMGLYTFQNICQTVLRTRIDKNIKAFYVYHTMAEDVQPHFAAMKGFIRSVNQESNRLFCQSVEIESESSNTFGADDSEIPEIVLQTYVNFMENEPEIRFAQGRQWVRRFQEWPEYTNGSGVILPKPNGVYLITGGMGGLGGIFARYLARHENIHLILSGRSHPGKLINEKLKEIGGGGSDVVYMRADVSDKAGVEALIAGIKKKYHQLDGVIHSAGVIADNYIEKKNFSETAAVLGPKVFGTAYLDEALKNEPLDFLVLFSSIAGALGNPGQSDYAYANSYMDSFSIQREIMRKNGHRKGKTISINWPLWKDGGMLVNAQTQKLMHDTTGLVPLEADDGVLIYEQAVSSPECVLSIVHGNEDKLRKLFGAPNQQEKDDAGKESPKGNDAPVDGGMLEEKFREDLLIEISRTLNIDKGDIDLDGDMSEFGFDSISVTEFTNRLNDKYGIDLTPALYFEHPSVGSFASYLLETYYSQISKYYQATQDKIAETGPPIVQQAEKPIGTPIDDCGPSIADPPEDLFRHTRNPEYVVEREDIAVIGMSGRFPLSDSLDVFWRNLVEERELISTIPPNRWDWKSHYGDATHESRKTRVKWGGFLNHIDRFDYPLFGILRDEAEMMDPQQRLFLETVWETIEDAGYKVSDFSGSKTGLFVGVASSDYSDIIRQYGYDTEPYAATGTAHSILANRVSYLLNLCGPSEPVNTACSSSLVAVYRAMESLRTGTCETALAGGVNVIASPNAYVSFSKAGMLTENGHCRTFDKNADGYVRGEGIGCLLLKPATKAIRDRDHIYGLIRGAAVNHCGRANSLTAPNPNAQAELIVAALKDSKVDPHTIRYIEAHGTGTKLGDPAEINGIIKAYGMLEDENIGEKEINRPLRCGIGSVKTNIGHLEAAAGVASIIKVLLALKNKTIPASINFSELNPYIRLDNTPFYIANRSEPWERATEKTRQKRIPRRAGVSSFGFGGANAHVVIEEFQKKQYKNRQETAIESIVVLSAKTEKQLTRYAENLLEFLERSMTADGPELIDIAYTLQTGRDVMDERLAIIGQRIEDIINGLKDFLYQNHSNEQVFSSRVGQSAETGTGTDSETHQDDDAGIDEWMRRGSLSKLANAWVQGNQMDWQKMYQEWPADEKPHRVSLPAYPFAEFPCWVSGPEREATNDASCGSVSRAFETHPLIDHHEKTGGIYRFYKTFTGKEFFLKNHGQLLPGVVYLEMARAAAEFAVKDSRVTKIRDVVFMSPLFIDRNPMKTRTVLTWKDNCYVFAVETVNDDKAVITHAEGKVVLSETRNNTKKDIDFVIKKKIREKNGGDMDALRFYDTINALFPGFLGPRFQLIDAIHYEDTHALAIIKTEDMAEDISKHYVLSPATTDSAVQTAVALAYRTAGKSTQSYLPFMIDELEIVDPSIQVRYAYAIQHPNEKNDPSPLIKNDILLLDEKGHVAVALKGLHIKEKNKNNVTADGIDYLKAGKAVPGETSLFLGRPAWNAKAITENRSGDTFGGNVLVFDYDAGVKDAITMGGSENGKAVLVKPGDYFHWADRFTFEISVGEYDDYVTLFDILDRMGALPEKIVHMWSRLDSDADEGQPIDWLNKSAYSVFFIAKALAGYDIPHKTRMVYVHPWDRNRSVPQFEAVGGLIRTINIEQPDMQCAAIGIPPAITAGHSNGTSELVRLLRNEFSGWEGRDIEIRYDGLNRYSKAVEEVSKAAFPAVKPLREEGVYLITGGAGNIGMTVAEHFAKSGKTKLIVLGRSKLTEEKRRKIKSLRRFGSEVVYVKADVSKRQNVRWAIKKILEKYKTLHGIVHLAGVVNDALLPNKSKEQMEQVLAAKVHGTLNLDAETKTLDLDFFVLFSSLSAVLGNAGQCDYAYGNSFMDNFAQAREALRTANRRSGKTLSINWPLWKNGGMGMNEEAEKLMMDTVGLKAIDNPTGLEIFEKGLSSPDTRIIVAAGDKRKLNILFGIENMPDKSNVEILENNSPRKGDFDSFRDALTSVVSEISRIEIGDISETKKLSDYGFESVAFTRLANRVNEEFGLNVNPAVFFKYQTIKNLAPYLYDRWNGVAGGGMVTQQPVENETAGTAPDPLPVEPFEDIGTHPIQKTRMPEEEAVAYQQNRTDADGDVAIIGVSGVFPGSPDVDAFWRHLANGTELITEIPKDRWDWRRYYGNPLKEKNKCDIKWGAFMDDVDKFDPRFFNISHREAELMDPQQRMLIEIVWKVIEDAAYRASDLAGTKTALYVGICNLDYKELLMKQGILAAGVNYATIVNRISYLFDFRGPSEPIDTACSSSLVALHRGVQDIRRGNCEMAIVGGGNIILNPDTYVFCAQNGMLSATGKCSAFDKTADGYVRGEGVGAVLLKPLRRARKDHDHIYGIIRGSMVNHGGQGSSPSAPNPGGQEQLLIETYRKFEIDPKTVSYIETHGTGTKLGDPIEVAALKAAFERLYTHYGKPVHNESYCGIGSVKTNVGHLESAAGMAGLFKVLLALREKMIPATLNFKTLNDYIDISESPFYVVDKNTPWKRAEDDRSRPIPRRAGISSFGIGGVNAHVVIEECMDPSGGTIAANSGEKRLVVFSAETKEQLGLYLESMKRFLTENGQKYAVKLDDVAYTTQIGREEMSERMAMIVSNMEELKQKIAAFSAGAESVEDVYAGAAGGNTPNHVIVDGEEGRAFVDLIIKNKNLKKIAELWTSGVKIDWALLYADGLPKRIPLPTYPFRKTRYWYDDNKKESNTDAPGGLSALKKHDAVDKAVPAREPNASETAMANHGTRLEAYRGSEVGLNIIDETIAVVSIQDRENRNMFSEKCIAGLMTVFDEIRRNEKLKTVVVTGDDKFFSMGGTDQALKSIAEKKCKFTDVPFIFKGLLECDLPVIAAMQGHAAGGGLLFGLYADIVIMAEESVYSAVFMKYGFTPGMGATFLLREKFGINLANEMMYTARSFRGDELKNRGANVVIKKQKSVLTEALSIARMISQKPRNSLVVLKKEMSRRILEKLSRIVETENEMHAQTFSNQDVLNRIEKYYNAGEDSPKNQKARTAKIQLPTTTKEAATPVTGQEITPAGNGNTRRPIKLTPKKPLETSNIPSSDTPENNGGNGNEKVCAQPIPIDGNAKFGEKTCNQDPLPRQMGNTAEIQGKIVGILLDIMRIPENEINLDEMTFKDMGVDSISGIEIIRDVNRTFNLNLEAIDLYEYSTISSLTKYVAEEVMKTNDVPQFLHGATEHADPHVDEMIEDADAIRLFQKLESGEMSIDEAVNMLPQ